MSPSPISLTREVSPRWYARVFTVVVGVVLLIAAVNVILDGSRDPLIYLALACAGIFAVLRIAVDWRDGLYFFVTWMLFEDLVRKYMGNNMLIYFGKDFLVAIVYLSFFSAFRQKTAKSFKPPFFWALAVFFWFAVLQVFNPNSPSIFLGLLGLKLYFYYIPLIFLGYSLVESEQSLQNFFRFTFLLASIIAGLGIVQAILGHTFLNPAGPAEDIKSLSTLYRYTPISGQRLYRPNSVFVSDGRFASYLFVVWLIAFGFGAFLFLRRGKHEKWLTYVTLAMATVAIVLSGSRGSVMWSGGAGAICIAAFLWGAPWRQGKAARVVGALQRVLVVGGLAVCIMAILYPKAFDSRAAFYSETLGLNSPGSELHNRTVDYPLQNFLAAFGGPHWLVGNGTGSASLGLQYVQRILHVDLLAIQVENGYGTIVIEFGIVGLILWILWTFAVAAACWRVARRLKGTEWFPIGFVIFLYVTLLFIPLCYTSSAAVQNYVMNAYAWLLIGVLFRLPEIAAKTPSSLRRNS